MYLAVSRWLAPDEVEAANARLAELLGGDRVGDRGRLMRLPGTRNLKGGAPGRFCRVVACDLHAPALELDAVVGTLPAQRPVASSPGRAPGRRINARLDEIAPRAWFAALEPDRPISDFGYAHCPLHDDHVPSLKLYDEARDGWYCWACARGGDILEYAAWRRFGRRSRDLASTEFETTRRWLEVHLLTRS
jgi:hypothetical protein